MYVYDVETKVQSSQWMGKSSPRPKIKHAGFAQMWRCCWWFCFDWKGIVPHEFIPRGQSIMSFTWRPWSVWGRQREGKGLRRGQTGPGCCTMTMHLPTRRLLSVNFWWSMKQVLSSAPVLSSIGLCRLFLAPKLEIHPKRSPISDGRGERRKFATGP